MFFRTSTNCPTNDGEAENMFCFRASTPSPPIESDIFNNMEADSIMDLTNDVDTETSMDNSSISAGRKRTHKDSSSSLDNFYRDLIKEVQKDDKETEVDFFFKSIATIVKQQNLSSLQFLDLQGKITSFIKRELENL